MCCVSYGPCHARTGPLANVGPYLRSGRADQLDDACRQDPDTEDHDAHPRSKGTQGDHDRQDTKPNRQYPVAEARYCSSYPNRQQARREQEGAVPQEVDGTLSNLGVTVVSGFCSGQFDAHEDDRRSGEHDSTGQEAVRRPACSTVSELGPKMSEKNQKKPDAENAET